VVGILGVPTLDSQPIDEHRRAGPPYEALGIEGELEIHSVEISSSSPPSTGEIRKNIAVIANSPLKSTIVEVFLKLIPLLHERIPEGHARYWNA
jgi:hypothetical protein